jgi:hypothetical protein
MNTFFAVAFGTVLLFMIGRSLFAVHKVVQTEMSANDRRVALTIVASILVAFVAIVVVLQSAR